ncbi:tetratricopeptide repeat protein [Catenulispora pinistramenti]|uniref:tetratricopeptide repeat protein n=1 Tax=Catenulispora pinistramenti TaxID=2705254 RepID=UPI0022A7D336|nr:tetratricopeptide repeat protein [Catenulispora pinistramenti]
MYGRSLSITVLILSGVGVTERGGRSGVTSGFGRGLRSLRKLAGMTQEELETASGTAVRTIGRLERGELENPQLSTVRHLAHALADALNRDQHEVWAELSALLGSEAVPDSQGPWETALSAASVGQPTPVLTPTVLRQLPPRVSSFTGRSAELARVVSALAPSAGAGAVGVSAVVGLAGVGKTALAVHAAHTAVEAGWFPGGVLFLDMHGYEEKPVAAAQALDALLRGLGMPGEMIPKDPQVRAGLYRSRLTELGGAVLVLADNVSESDQVLPLVPGDVRHRVLVTSRHALPRLGARLLDLTVLPSQEAVEVLKAALRIAAEDDERIGDGSDGSDGAGTVAHYCGYLPLALQIAAAQLAADPDLTLTELTDQLADTTTRLTHLDDGERAVRAAFNLSYQRLTEDQARMFRLLALNPGPDVATAAAAVLADTPEPLTGRLLADLVRAHLLERASTRGRWRMHDLIAAYARDLTTREPEPERMAPVHRLLDYYLRGARSANRHVEPARDRTPPVAKQVPDVDAADPEPCFATRYDALAWFAAERQNLEGCTLLAASTGQSGYATGIARASAAFFRHAGYWRQAVDLHDTAARAATAANDWPGQADALRDLGVVQRLTGEFVSAGINLVQTLSLYRSLGDLGGQADALCGLGVIQHLTGEFAAATAGLGEALALYHELDDRGGQADALCELGVVQHLTGEFAAATAGLGEALALYRRLGDRGGQANALRELGAVRWMTGEYSAATSHLTEALALYQDLGLRLGRANALRELGAVQVRTGEFAAATATLAETMSLYQDLGLRLGRANVLRELGAVQMLTGEFAAAGITLVEALSLYRDIGDRGGEVWALNYYAALATATGAPRYGHELFEEALTLAREVNSRWCEANALDGIATTHESEGDAAAANEYFQQALELYRAMGCGRDVARVEDALAGVSRAERGARWVARLE